MTEKAFADIAKDFEVVNRIRFDMTTLNV
jgi:hypothetical protein